MTGLHKASQTVRELGMRAPFQLRRRNTEDPVRSAAPGIQLRQGRNCEIVCGTGIRSPASVKLGNPETSGRTFDLKVAVPIGEPDTVTAMSGIASTWLGI